MSKFSKEIIPCPNCNHTKEINLYSSLNVSVDPEKKQDLFQGHINYFNCDKCDFEDFIPDFFMYHDMDAGYCIFYILGDFLNDKGVYDLFDSDVALSQYSNMPNKVAPEYLKKPHLVFSMHELIIYIQFRDNLSLVQEQKS